MAVGMSQIKSSHGLPFPTKIHRRKMPSWIYAHSTSLVCLHELPFKCVMQIHVAFPVEATAQSAVPGHEIQSIYEVL